MINGTVCCNVHSSGDAPVVSPVGFVQDDDLVSSFGQCDFLLSKHLDLVPHHIDSSADKQSIVTHSLMYVQTTAIINLTTFTQSQNLERVEGK